jgi:hypothetical protein
MFAPVAAHAAPYFGERGKFFAFGLSDIEHNTRPGNPMTWADSPYKCRAEYGVKVHSKLKAANRKMRKQTTRRFSPNAHRPQISPDSLGLRIANT